MESKELSHCHALIMAGGKGERFWPWSRESRPKQLLPLFGKKTMIEMTVDRLTGLIPKSRIWIVTNAHQAKLMQRAMPRFPKSNYIIEPVGRDSAGAVMLGCAQISRRDPKAVMALLPADALIKNVRKYHKVMLQCFLAASKPGVMVMVGIRPTGPSSAYGYIESGKKDASLSGKSVAIHRATRFLEKPTVEKAKKLVTSGRYYWNAGMFLWSGETIYEAFRRHSPVHARGWEAILKNAAKYLRGDFLKLPKISIDYAVMEKVKSIHVAPADFDWDDVGAWSAMRDHLQKDASGNAVQGNVMTLDTQGSLILGGKKLIATIGIQDLVVIETADAILIASRDATQRVKEVVKKLPKELK